MSRGERVRIDGLLLLDKPLGISSNQALQQLKRLYRAAKAGHGGTLDPLASGMLPIAFGEATKFLHALLEADKCYEASVVLGRSSSTGDAEGVLSDWVDPRPLVHRLDEVLQTLRTSTQQRPPMHSAIKREGHALYRLARQGIEVDRPLRHVRIHRLDMIDMVECEGLIGTTIRVGLRVCCSKGTYVRSLAEDLGALLGCGAYLGDLRRTRIGELDAGSMVSIEDLLALDEPRRTRCLFPVDHLLRHLPKVELGGEMAERFRLGQRLRLPSSAVPKARAASAASEATAAPAAYAASEATAAPAASVAFAESGSPVGMLQVRVYELGSSLLGTATLDPSGRLAPQRLVARQAAQALRV